MNKFLISDLKKIYSATFDLFTVQNQTLAVASRTPNSFLHVTLMNEAGLVLVDTTSTLLEENGKVKGN